MIAYKRLKSLWEDHARHNPRSLAAARVAALGELYEHLGIAHAGDGVPAIPLDERGLPEFRPNRISAREFSLRSLAESIMGHEFVNEYYHPRSGYHFRGLQEAALDPSAMVNISTFNLATAGLVQAEIMEGFNAPEFIGRNLVRIVPTNKNGDKLIGVARMGKYTKDQKRRQPGDRHAETGFGEAYQTTPETVEQAIKCRLTREVVYFDLTGQVMDEAREGIGMDLGYGQEVDIADMVLGVTNSYNRNGTSHNTYLTASPYINDHSNPFSDEGDVDEARQLFVGMTDPETGREIVVQGRDILCMPARELKFREQLFGTQVQVGTQNTAGNFPARWKLTGPQIAAVSGGAYTVTPMSSIWYNRATASDGLNLSAANAKEYWFVGDFQNAFHWRENWGLSPWSANADELTLKDEGLIAVFGANYRGVAYVREPRYVVRNKN